MRTQVAWVHEGPPAGEPEKVQYADEDMAGLRVVDRGLIIGDVVAAASAPLGQVGCSDSSRCGALQAAVAPSACSSGFGSHSPSPV
jgi:hypothetical protein